MPSPRAVLETIETFGLRHDKPYGLVRSDGTIRPPGSVEVLADVAVDDVDEPVNPVAVATVTEQVVEPEPVAEVQEPVEPVVEVPMWLEPVVEETPQVEEPVEQQEEVEESAEDQEDKPTPKRRGRRKKTQAED